MSVNDFDSTPLLSDTSKWVPAKKKKGESIDPTVVFRIAVVFFGNVLTSAPLSSFPILEPEFIKFGIFGEDCEDKIFYGCDQQIIELTQWYTVSYGCALVSLFFVGLVFDRIGARLSAFFGGVGVTLSAVGLYVGFRFSPHYNWLLFVSMTSMSVFGLLNSMALFGFIYHFPKYQATVMGISVASYYLSGGAGYLIGLALDKNVFSLKGAMLTLAVITSLGTFLSSLPTPSKSEYSEMATKAQLKELETQKQLQSEQTPTPTPLPEPNQSNEIVIETPHEHHHHHSPSFLEILKMPFASFFNALIENLALLLMCGAGYCLVIYWISIIYPYMLYFTKENDASKYANYISLATSFVPVVVAPSSGWLFDKIGVLKAAFLTSFCLIGGTVTLIQETKSQLVAAALFSAYLVFCGVFISKWCALYSSAEGFGAFYGLIWAVIGGASVAANVFLPPYMSDKFPDAYQFFWVLVGWFGMSFIGSIVLIIRIFFRPPAKNFKDVQAL